MSQYHGFDQNDFELKGIGCRVVAPKQAAPGLPWIWRARFWGHEPQTEIALLERGFHVAYCDVADLWGNKEAIRRWDDFYQYLTSKHGFSRRPALEGMSRGGLIIYHWAIQHPDQVSCIYGDAPALGIRPYVREITKDDDPALDKLRGWMKAHELSLAEAKSTNFDALARLDSLAMAGVPVIHVCGDADESVPFEEHTAEFARRYKKLGGPIKVIVKKGGKHHPHSLKDPTPIVDFVVHHQMWVDKRLTHGPMIGHATPASLLVWARCADPGEYQLTAHSETGHAVKAKAQSTPERDGCVQWKLDGLRPGTRYDYQIDIDGKKLVHGDDFSFTTEDPASSAAVRLAFGSCERGCGLIGRMATDASRRTARHRIVGRHTVYRLDRSQRPAPTLCRVRSCPRLPTVTPSQFTVLDLGRSRLRPKRYGWQTARQEELATGVHRIPIESLLRRRPPRYLHKVPPRTRVASTAIST
jgi:pimeloyl-ACP methyl ester carboxylesterase